MRRPPRCEICEKQPAQEKSKAAPHGWCDECETGFDLWRLRVSATCVDGCQTPYSCQILKRCARAEAQQKAIA